MKALLIFLLLPLHLLAQDLTGVWKGFLKTSGSEVPYEIVISEDEGKLSGYSLTVFTFNEVENIGVKSIKLKTKKENLLLEDGELIYNNYSTPPKRTKFFATFSIKEENGVMILAGGFQTRSLDLRVPDSYSGTVRLLKQSNEKESSKLLAKLDELKLLQTLSFVAPKKKQEKATVAAAKKTSPSKEKLPAGSVKPDKPIASATAAKKELPKPVEPAAAIAIRKTEIIQSVFFVSDSLVLTLFDNGEIDGDTVSVVLNNQILIAKKGLSSNALKTVVHVTPDMGDSLQLVMYAENLGRIPPNTGLLIVEDGRSRYEIRFAGDLQKNSAIILKRRR